MIPYIIMIPSDTVEDCSFFLIKKRLQRQHRGPPCDLQSVDSPASMGGAT